MNQFALAFALLCGLTLAGLGASLFGLLWMHRAVRAAAQRAEARLAESDATIEAVRSEAESCARQLRELRQEPPRTNAFAAAQPGLNLSKRSQALRMHRRGDTPEQIASTLGVPLQEVELLLKVHRIVVADL
jgi:DNA-binding NarL/FixJ family response regulator